MHSKHAPHWRPRALFGLVAALAIAAAVSYGFGGVASGSTDQTMLVASISGASTSNPIFWDCFNPSTGAPVGNAMAKIYLGPDAAAPLNRTPGCSSWAILGTWNAQGPVGKAGADAPAMTQEQINAAMTAVCGEDLVNCKGPKGDTGATGADGTAGQNGADGTNGTDGADALLTVSAQTSVSNWPEGSGWATDAYVRTATITRQSAVDASKCGATAKACWFYTGTLMDSGSFTTNDGAKSPAAGTAINGTVTGTMVGGTKVEFYASTDTPDASQVAATVDGANAGGLTTSGWVKQFFGDGTVFGSISLPSYSWTYAAPATCESWADSINPGDDGANAAVDGDITGVNACTP